VNLVIQFLDYDGSTFLAVPPERLQIRQLEPGKCALGALVDQPKKSEDGTPIVGEVVSVFVPLINYAMDIQASQPAKPEPKVELATEMPKAPKPKGKKARVQ
jgi:hypothetical protein